MLSGADLEAALADVLGADSITGLTRLSGGASAETWSFDALVPDGGVRGLVLRRMRPGPRSISPPAPERLLLEAAAAQGVPVPAVVIFPPAFCSTLRRVKSR